MNTSLSKSENSMPLCRVDYASIVTLIIFATFVLLLGFYLGLYNDLAYDDFGRSRDIGKGFFHRVLKWYYGHNGRFFNAVITSHFPIYQLGIYKFLHIITMGTWLCSLFVFVNQYCKYIGRKFIYIRVAFFCAVVFLAITINAPNLSEWWFWYASSSVYLVGTASLFFGASVYITALGNDRMLYWCGAGIFLFLAVGSHEILMLISLVATVFVGLCVNIFNRQKRALIPFLFVLIAVCLVIFSPGSSNRMEAVTQNSVLQQLVEKIFIIVQQFFPVLSAGLDYWTSNSVWILVAVISFLLGAKSYALKEHIKNLKHRMLGIFILSCLVILVTPILPIVLNMNININDASRTANLAYCMFILLIALNAFNFGVLVSQKLLGFTKIAVSYTHLTLPTKRIV